MIQRHPVPIVRRRSHFVPAVGIALLSLSSIVTVRADVVTRRDGAQVEGDVVSVDASAVLVKTERGVVRLDRASVASIQFLESAAVRPIKVEIRNVKSDDSIDVLLNDEPVLVGGREGGDWIDLTPKLKDGNNALRLRIRNDRGTWAYRLNLRLNGKVTVLSCGTPLRPDDPCRCCGKTGREVGIIDDLPVIWVNVDRALGRAEVLP